MSDLPTLMEVREGLQSPYRDDRWTRRRLFDDRYQDGCHMDISVLRLEKMQDALNRWVREVVILRVLGMGDRGTKFSRNH